MKKRNCFWYLFLLIVPFFSHAQQRFWEVDASMHYGYILKHQFNVKHLAASHPAGFNLSFYKITHGAKGWESSFRYPKIGVSFQFLDYNNGIIGQSYAIVPNMKFNWIKRKRSDLEFKIGTGLAVFTNHFNLDTNPKNTVISHPMNFSMHFALLYTYALSPNIKLKIGTEFIHYSNAAFTLPNAGINVHTISFGVYYHPKAQNMVFIDSLRPFKKEWMLETSLMGSLVERVPAQGYKNSVTGGTVMLARRVSRKSILHLGLDYSANAAIREQISEEYRGTTDKIPDYRRLAILFGHEWLAGKVALITDIGIYVYRPFDRIDKPFYQRIGVRYYFSDKLKWWGQFGIKTHYGAAEYTELMVGYNFRKKSSN